MVRWPHPHTHSHTHLHLPTVCAVYTHNVSPLLPLPPFPPDGMACICSHEHSHHCPPASPLVQKLCQVRETQDKERMNYYSWLLVSDHFSHFPFSLGFMNFTTYYCWYQYASVVHKCMIMWFYWITIPTLVTRPPIFLPFSWHSYAEAEECHKIGSGHTFTFTTVPLWTQLKHEARKKRWLRSQAFFKFLGSCSYQPLGSVFHCLYIVRARKDLYNIHFVIGYCKLLCMLEYLAVMAWLGIYQICTCIANEKLIKLALVIWATNLRLVSSGGH